MAIPKIIHQTYRTKVLPSDIEKIISDLKQLNPDWEYRFYTDDDILNYIKLNYEPRILNSYLAINPIYGAAKADFFRYLLLYREGGVYLDIKSTCIYPLNTVIHDDDKFIITQWQNEKGQINEGAGLFDYLINDLGVDNGEYQQWFIISEPKSPFLKQVISHVVNNIDNYKPWKYKLNSYGKKGVLFVTGPVAYTKAIQEVIEDFPHRFERYDKNLGFIYNALNNKSHTKVLSKHYANFKEPIVRKGVILNFIFSFYISVLRILKNFKI
ncbi:glycosyltransferase family 32 protein [Acinetobacter sp. Ver3]|uniref:glycosyltransferase family 32 protein n=1 Tax=Acinetobacter sp. Ver3 TaxID=466088 RepID=UPI000445E066|nr:glycosyltransferase [Acinetobacter sp. Ver3]EZQ11583.1 hypothetical protein CL42_04530 [Acinetobacter sp. Ver3]